MAMTRRRTITPEAFSREELLSLPPTTRLFEMGLRLCSDDQGRGRVNQRLLLAQIFPLDAALDESAIDEMLLDLDAAGAIVIYDADGRTYWQITSWPKVDRPTPSKNPAPPLANHSRTTRGEGEGVRESSSERESEREWERSSDSESDEERDGGGPTRAPRDPNLPPSPFCPAHQESGGTDGPCRSCGRARLQRKVWDDQHTHGTPAPPTSTTSRRPRFDVDPDDSEPDIYDLLTH